LLDDDDPPHYTPRAGVWRSWQRTAFGTQESAVQVRPPRLRFGGGILLDGLFAPGGGKEPPFHFLSGEARYPAVGQETMADILFNGKHPYCIQRFILTVQMAMIAVMCLLILLQGKLPGWDMAGLILFTLFLWIMRDRVAFLDFAPFLLMLFTYEVIRSVILAVGTSGVHVADLIVWEKTLCAGFVPSHVLQQAFGNRAYTWAVDIVANAFYLTHFFSVILLGVILWLKRKAHYWAYVTGLIALSYAAFLAYVLFPAAPPWWASMHGYLGNQPVNLDHSLLTPEHIFNTANALGAMPSLHTAWPSFLFFYCLYVWGRKMIPVVILPIGVAVSSIYLGHHYMVDVLAGIGCAAGAFAFATQWGKIYLKAQEPVHSLVAV
jgi:membrane-associated phospholipid phosphatase